MQMGNNDIEYVPYECVKGVCTESDCGWDSKTGTGGLRPLFARCPLESDEGEQITYRVYKEEVQQQSIGGTSSFYEGEDDDDMGAVQNSGQAASH